ncbi:hypothetical protein [Treponema sp. R80B11-R83G3]
MLKDRKNCSLVGMVAILAFTVALIACSDGNDNDSDKTLTYKGTSGSYEWVLKITGDTYELTKGVGFGTSTGDVINKQGSTYYLKPSVTATAFTATVSSAGLVELLGTITWYAGGQPDPLPGQLIPSGGTGGNGGGGGNTPVSPSIPETSSNDNDVS